MKKIFLCILAIITVNAGFGISVDKLISLYSHEENVTVEKMTKLNNKKIRQFNRSAKNDRLHLKSVIILHMNECPAQVKENFRNDLNSTDLDAYETMIRKNTENKQIKFLLLSPRNNIIREILIIVTSDDKTGLARIKGKGDITKLSNVKFQIDGIGNND